MATSLKRSVQIKVTLTPELHAKLAEVSRQVGQSPATLCSVWIGQSVAQMSRNLGATDRAIELFAKELGPDVREQLRLVAAAESAK